MAEEQQKRKTQKNSLSQLQCLSLFLSERLNSFLTVLCSHYFLDLETRFHACIITFEKDERASHIKNASFFFFLAHATYKNLETHTHARHHLATTTTGGDDDRIVV